MSKENKEFANKLVHFSEINDLVEKISSTGKKITLCHGVFDLLHPGHIRHLAKAKELGEILIVSITADKYVNKGPGRPAFPEGLRAESLANIISVDYVVITPFPTAVEIINAIKPNNYVKGNDYVDENSDKTGNIVREKELVESLGGRLFYTDEIIFSSSQLINKFISSHSSEVSAWLRDLKLKYTKSEILNWLNKVSKLKVAVIGEAILDVYTECDALGKSAKDPVLCFSKGSTVSYAGGILAIGGHINGLGANTTIVTGLNGVDLNLDQIKNLKNKGISLQILEIAPSPTIRKQRFVDSRTSTRVFELYEMDDIPLTEEKDREFIRLISESISGVDVVIVADYGHGLISEKAINLLATSGKFLCVNTQTNAGNRGFNSISRYPKMDFITLNGMEAQLETRRRHMEIRSFIEQLQKTSSTNQIVVTRGGDGMDIFSKNEPFCHSPALAPYVKDRVGAGDVVLTITSLLAALQAPPEIIGFYGNVCGAWAVSFIGNEKSLDLGTINRYANSLLS
jgi:rfaE bifunctional protein kinase chain/domain/rfaE bifunctional protein nucleotidyltransferase chain/domain